jgi:hypothetical protein
MTTAATLPTRGEPFWLAGARIIHGLGGDPVPRAAVQVADES